MNENTQELKKVYLIDREKEILIELSDLKPGDFSGWKNPMGHL